MPPTSSRIVRSLVAAGLGLALAACASAPMGAPVPGAPFSAAPAGAVAARSILLAEGTVPSLPAAPVAWVAEAVSFYERVVSHQHEAAFVYAAVTPSRLFLPTGARSLAPGQAVFVPAGVWHTHDRTCVAPTECHDSLWEIRLASPRAPLPSGDMRVARAFVRPVPGVTLGAPARLRLELIDGTDAALPDARAVRVPGLRQPQTLLLRIE